MPHTAIPRISPQKLVAPLKLASPGFPESLSVRRMSQGSPPSRLLLVNPKIAAHLKRGGLVNVRSIDGERSWRVFLPASPGDISL